MPTSRHHLDVDSCEQFRSISITKQSGEPRVIPIQVCCDSPWVDGTKIVDNATGDKTLLYVCDEHSIDFNPPTPENVIISELDFYDYTLYVEPSCCANCRYYFDITSGYCGCL